MSAGQNCLVLTGMRLWNTNPGPADRDRHELLTMPDTLSRTHRNGIRRFYRRMRASGLDVRSARRATLFAITDMAVGWQL